VDDAGMSRSWTRLLAALLLALLAAHATTPTAEAAGSELDEAVRPGMPWFLGPTATGGRFVPCTADFLYTARGDQYWGTAGHCVEYALSSGQDISRVRDATGRVVGSVAGFRVGSRCWPQACHPDVPDSFDYALIRLARDVRGVPAVCHFGGPTGMDSDDRAGPRTVHLFGAGRGVGFVDGLPAEAWILPGRSGVAWLDGDWGWVDAPLSVNDSGAPVLDADGRAVGVLLSSFLTDGQRPGIVTGTSPVGPGLVLARLTPLLEWARLQFDLRLELQTAPVSPDPLPVSADCD
jgi:hypothetical protein